jgi:hypothetical protein
MLRSTRSTNGTLRLFALIALATGGVVACSDDSTSPPAGLSAPAGLVAAQVSLTEIALTWNAVTGASSYLLERASAANPGVFAAVGGTLATTSYTDNTVTAGVAYSYRVAAVAGADTSDFSAAVNFTTGLATATITGNITADRTLRSDTVYTLLGYVKVQSGAVLTIEPGTRIVGDAATLGSSLWILRGARIEANGTAAEPIVFTSAKPAGTRAPGDWGGLIIIGNGIISRGDANTVTEGPAGVSEAYGGGTNNNDNSGTLRYVRIEFAGYDVSQGGGQELNALSLYAVGRGTTIEYVQTMAGLDDSFEYFGGAVDGRYLVSYESGDDHFDASEGYSGRNQFLIAFQSQRLIPAPNAGTFSSDPRGFEIDGCEPKTGSSCSITPGSVSTPYTMPVFANFTVVGTGNLASIPGDGNGMVLRRGTGGHWYNGVIARWKGIGISVRDQWSDTLLSQRDSLNIVGVLLAQNGGNYDSTSNFGTRAKFASDGHTEFSVAVAADTLLGINLNPTGLDWTPKAGSPATTGGQSIAAGRVAGFFGGTWANTTYRGAAEPGGTKWWQGWTAYNIN